MVTTRQLLSNYKRGLVGILLNNTERTLLPNSTIKKALIGKTVLEKDIFCYEIGSGKQKVLFVSAIHGNETGTVKLAYELIDFLNTASTDLRESFTFYIIPCLNIDGYTLARKNPEYFRDGRIGRLNANNVDLNRNFQTPSFKNQSVYSSGKDYSNHEVVYAGPHAHSEPETKSLTSFIERNGIELIVSFHNKGCDVTGNAISRSRELARMYAETIGFKYIDEQTWAALGQTGTLKEWSELKNIPYIEIEGSTRWGSDWKKQKRALLALIRLVSKDPNSSS
jgi:hypothetical protein